MCISFVGSGNLATQLVQRLYQKKICVDLVISRNINSDIGRSTTIAVDGIKVPSTNVLRRSTNYFDVSPDTELIIIAVSDDAIVEVAKKLSPLVPPTTLVVHTSGSIHSTVLKPYFKNFGTLYPLQTFTKNTAPDFNKIPIFCNVSSTSKSKKDFYKELLTNAANLFSPQVYFLSDEDRLHLHIAAVFANNFTNHLFGISKSILADKQIPFSVLLPLIQETVHKIERESPEKIQTGPAARGDAQTIKKHLALLAKKNKLYKEIYSEITNSIQKGF